MFLQGCLNSQLCVANSERGYLPINATFCTFTKTLMTMFSENRMDIEFNKAYKIRS